MKNFTPFLILVYLISCQRIPENKEHFKIDSAKVDSLISAPKILSNSRIKDFKEVKFALLSEPLEKVEMLLGIPEFQGELTEEKQFLIYTNRVNEKGRVLNVVVFLRYYWKEGKTLVEEIYAVPNNVESYFGIHFVAVDNGKLRSNAVLAHNSNFYPIQTLEMSLYGFNKIMKELIRQFSFKSFEPEEYASGSKAQLDFSSNNEALTYKENIESLYQDGKMSFAGSYVPIYFACGTMCEVGFIIDTRDGKIYKIPFNNNHRFDRFCEFTSEKEMPFTCMVTSKLLIAFSCLTNQEPFSDQKYSYDKMYEVLEWKENEKKFVSLRQIVDSY